MKNKLKAGIVGFGYMGEIRKRICEEHPDLMLAAICDTSQGAARNIAGAVPFYTSHKELINQDIDLVFVCTPNLYTPDIVVDSLMAQKHVFCEKPPGRTVEDIERIIEAEKTRPSLKLKFGFNHRYHPGILEAKSLIASGKFGRILWVRGVYGKSGGVKFKSSWRNKKEVSGGGILLDQGIHMLDLFRFFCGDFTETKSFMTDAYWKYGIEDNAMVILKSKHGQIASLHSSSTLWKHTFHIMIGLEEGYLNVSGFLSRTGSYGRETLVIGRRQFEDESSALGNPREEVIYFDKDDSWYLEVDDMLCCIKGNKKVQEASSSDALHAMQLINIIYKENGKSKTTEKEVIREASR